MGCFFGRVCLCMRLLSCDGVGWPRCTIIIVQLNPESEVVMTEAVIDPSVLQKEHSVGTPLQVGRGKT